MAGLTMLDRGQIPSAREEAKDRDWRFYAYTGV